MIEFSKRLGLCLGIAASFCLAACGGESGNDGGGGGDETQVGCTSNSDCKDADKPVCDQDKKECIAETGEAEPECKEDKDCTDPAKSKCNAGKCEADTTTPTDTECTDDKDCTDSSKPKCNAGKCEAASTTPTDQTKCNDGEEQCGDGCHLLKSDDLNCGSCGNACQENEKCNEGVCGMACEGNDIPCGGVCVNTQTDDNNCGTCGNKCTDNKTCKSGECSLSCSAGFDLCGTECLNLDSDESCGTCDSHKACNTSAGESCSNRECKTVCPSGQEMCNGTCIDFKSDKNNCGGCGEEHKCAEGQKCNNGECGTDCGENKVDCDGNCIDPKTSADFCGANASCAEFTVCTGEGLSCTDGVCACANSAETKCPTGDNSYVCADPKTSNTYCGCGEENREHPAGINCATLPGISTGSCTNGTCDITCDGNHMDCNNDVSDGCEADLTSIENCGACGNVCEDENASSKSCVDGTCRFICNQGMASCDGKCLDIRKDPKNCGACGNECSSNATCENGFCVISEDECDSDGYVNTKINEQEIKAFCIRTKMELEAMRNAINEGKKYPNDNNSSNAYILMQPLNLGTDAWVSIGNIESRAFTGIFMGNGQLVQGNFKYTGPEHGLFGWVTNAILDGFNLKIDMSITNASGAGNGGLVGITRGSTVSNSRNEGNITVTSSSGNVYERTGLLLGKVFSSTVVNCSSSGKITGNMTNTTGGKIGGLIGSLETNTTIDHCHSDAEVICNGTSSSNTESFGGLIGVASHSAINNSYSTGSVKSTTAHNSSWGGFGGLVGWLRYGSSISDSYSTANVNVLTPYAGGLVGRIGYSNTPTESIMNSYATGEVKCPSYCGGLLGTVTSLTSQKITISNCYATGNVSSNGSYGGGLVGYFLNGTISESYSTGNVAGTNKDANSIGGSVGKLENAAIDVVYAKGNASGGAINIGGLVGWAVKSTLSNCAAFGTVTNTKFISTTGGRSGGLIGAATDGNTIYNCMAAGNTTGENQIGSLIGYLARGANTLRNVYVTGSITGHDYTNSMIGVYDNASIVDSGNTGGTLAVKNSYYWKKISENPIGGSTPNEAAAYPFDYNENKEAAVSAKKKLVDALGVNDWSVSACTLAGGPKGEYSIPLPKGINVDICK